MTRGAARGFGKARRLYRLRRYPELISYLEPQVFMYRESYAYYYLLGMSCLHTGDYAGAYSYLRRALDIDERVEAMLALVAVPLRRRNEDQALRTYLDVLDLEPRNRKARRALQWLSSLDAHEKDVEWLEYGRINGILPSRGFYVPRPVFFVVILLALGVAGFFGLSPFLQWVERWTGGEPREGIELLSITSEDVRVVESATTQAYELSERELNQLFQRIGDLFNDGQDNLVRRELNRLRLSNATPALKARAELVRDYLNTPDFSNFANNASYQEVVTEPALYQGVFVRWRGRVANLEVSDDRIQFDLLVGYESRQVLDGIVPASLDFAVLVENDQAVEVVGQLDTTDASPRLRVTSFRRLPPEN